ncbi:hypothetical protein D9M71_570600 [compost metagenome]
MMVLFCSVARAVEPFQFCIRTTSPEAMRSTVLSELYIFRNGFCFCRSSRMRLASCGLSVHSSTPR